MLQVFSTKRPVGLSAYSLLAAIFLAALACSHNTSSNFQEVPAESETVSMRNPNVIIEPPVNFAWLPESINAYYLAGLSPGSNFPSQKTIQEAITEHLTVYGYVYNGSAHFGKALIDRRTKRTDIQPKDLIVVKNWMWAANFGASGLLREITLENRSNQDVRDLKIKVSYLGTTREKEGYWGPTSIFVIHDSLPANSQKTFRDINIGFRHPDGIRENMSVLSAKTVIHDLLIGYYLVAENIISDRDLNRIYNIAKDGSENRSNSEYKKGTVIIDLINAETRVLIWRGAMQTLPSFDVSDYTKQKNINLSVEKLINNFIKSNK